MWKILVVALPLAGCGVAHSVKERVTERLTKPPPLPERPDDSCLSAGFRQYIGQPVGIIDDIVFAQPMRILAEAAARTEDYDPTRINFQLDRAGNIVTIWCG